MGVREGAERRVRLRREAGVRRSGPGPERTVNGREVPGRRREAKPLGTEAWGGDAAASEPRGGQLSRPLLTDRTGCSPGLSPLGRSFSGGRSPRDGATGQRPRACPSARRARAGHAGGHEKPLGSQVRVGVTRQGAPPPSVLVVA